MRRFSAAFDLVPDQVEQIVRLAGLAPSPHNSQPWWFRVLPHVIEVHCDPARPAADPAARELRLACGAALMNLRLALANAGVRPVVRLLPSLCLPTVLAEVRSGGYQRPEAEHIALYEAIPEQHTQQRPIPSTTVPVATQHEMTHAARVEGGYLHLVQPAERGVLEGLVHHVHRDLTSEAPPPRTAGFEADPLLAVLCALGNGPDADLRAGQALQRVWLTATARGLVAAMLSDVVEIPEIRNELRRLLGDAVRPQALLRIGYGARSPTASLRTSGDLLIDAFPTSDRA